MDCIPEEFFLQDTVTVARGLLGKVLCHGLPGGRVAGEIVETEAYLSEGDPSCHSYWGMTPRNQAMFGPPGTAYVYLIYGIHYCFNVVTREEGIGEAVLIRALIPLEGIEIMQQRRGTGDKRKLTSGPGKLCQALGIDRRHNGCSLRQGALLLLDSPGSPPVGVSPRIGVPVEPCLPLRFFVPGSPYLSR